MSNELKPCPFCGGTEAFVERLDYSSAYVQCDSDVGDNCSCQARGPIAVQDGDGEETPGEAGAIRNWNRRAAPSVASAAPDDELPMLPDPYGTIAVYGDDAAGTQTHEVDGWTADQMRGYAIDYGMKLGRSAIAAASQQAVQPKAAMTDDQIKKLADELDWNTCEFDYDVQIAFARAIEAASSPNQALVEALKSIALWELPATGQTWPSGGAISYEAAKGSHGARDYIRQVAFSALAAAGVEAKP